MNNSNQIELRVPNLLSGVRLDKTISTLLGISRSEVSELISNQCVLLNGNTLKSPSKTASNGDSIRIVFPQSDTPSLQPPDLAPPDANSMNSRFQAPDLAPPGAIASIESHIVYSDSDLVVIDKPAGIIVHPGAGNSYGTLIDALVGLFPDIGLLAENGICAKNRPGIVHRLDKNTSGLMVVARSELSYHSLVAQLSSRQVERVYRCLVWGSPKASDGVVDGPIGRSSSHRTKFSVVAQGKPSITRFHVLERFGFGHITLALLECKLETGRTHQIRVHLSQIGLPVVGDDQYGGAVNTKRDPVGVLSTLKRQFLHAGQLAFVHPATEELVTFRSHLPVDLQQALDGLKLATV